MDGIYSESKRKGLIKKEYTRLMDALGCLDDTRRAVLVNLVEEAAFQAVTLEEARLIIQRDGIVEEYQNGANQSGKKKSSVVEVYDRLTNTYLKTITAINRELPEKQQIHTSPLARALAELEREL